MLKKFTRAEIDMKKAWITNPRGDSKNDKDHDDYIEDNRHVKKQGIPFDTVNPDADRRKERLHKEGDGGGIGGEGAGTVFTSENAGIFTPTHSERGRKEKRKKTTGIDRLTDFITERSPERKMTKGFALELVQWVRKELQKNVSYGTGEFTGDKRQRVIGGRGPQPQEPSVEFKATPSKSAASDQLAEEARIKKLKGANEEDNTPETGQASTATPAGLNVQLQQMGQWDAGSSQADALERGGDQDQISEEDQRKLFDQEIKEHAKAEKEQSRSKFLQKMLSDLA